MSSANSSFLRYFVHSTTLAKDALWQCEDGGRKAVRAEGTKGSKSRETKGAWGSLGS